MSCMWVQSKPETAQMHCLSMGVLPEVGSESFCGSRCACSGRRCRQR